MNIAVIGGTGTLGSRAVTDLAGRGHCVRILSRTPPAGSPVAHHRVDLRTGAGLDTALTGVDAVIDAANATRHPEAVLVEGTRRLALAGARAGVGHHLLISIVGIDRVPVGYYRAKLAQEAVLAQTTQNGAAHVTVLRATQFHQLLDGYWSRMSRAGVVPGGGLRLQPIDPDAVARRAGDLIEQGPGEERVEIAGPEVQTLAELSRTWLAARAKRRFIVPVPALGAAGRAVGDGALTAPDGPRAGIGFGEWLRAGEA